MVTRDPLAGEGPGPGPATNNDNNDNNNNNNNNNKEEGGWQHATNHAASRK